MQQQNYTDDDQGTWQTFFQEFRTHIEKNKHVIHPFFLENLHVLDRFSDAIPTLDEINDLLKPIGWSAEYVDGYAPGWEIARMINSNTVPISSQIRSPEESLLRS